MNPDPYQMILIRNTGYKYVFFNFFIWYLLFYLEVHTFGGLLKILPWGEESHCVFPYTLMPPAFENKENWTADLKIGRHD